MARKPIDKDDNVVHIKRKKTGKPQALEREEELKDQQSPEDFAKEFFPSDFTPEPQNGLPSIDWLKQQFKTKSAAIRYLHSDEGGAHPPKVISKHLGIRYQHARNVCVNPLKRGPNEDWRPKQKPPLVLEPKPEGEQSETSEED